MTRFYIFFQIYRPLHKHDRFIVNDIEFKVIDIGPSPLPFCIVGPKTVIQTSYEARFTKIRAKNYEKTPLHCAALRGDVFNCAMQMSFTEVV